METAPEAALTVADTAAELVLLPCDTGLTSRHGDPKQTASRLEEIHCRPGRGRRPAAHRDFEYDAPGNQLEGADEHGRAGNHRK